MYIDVDGCMYKESAGVKSRLVYHCFWDSRGSVAHVGRRGAARESVSYARRHDPARPHVKET